MVSTNTTDKSNFGFTILGSGSRGNATVVHGPAGDLLLDAGFSAKELCRRMELRGINPDKIRAVLVTHEHLDHVQGCRVFADSREIPVYLTAGTGIEMDRKKLSPERRILIEPGNPFELCGMEVEPFSVPHDVADAVAYTFECGGRKLGYATDLGMVSMLVVNKLCGCDALVLESNYDPAALMASGRPLPLKRRIMSRHGHLSNEAALETIRSVLSERTHCLILAHLSEECNNASLVECGLRNALAACSRPDIDWHVANQDAPLETYWISTIMERINER